MGHYDECRDGYCGSCGQGPGGFDGKVCSNKNCSNHQRPKAANSHQVGGDHYKSDFQHWDMIEENGIGYLEAAATKYITRWRDKNGFKDLEKAGHYTQKLIEMHLERGREPRGKVSPSDMALFASSNSLGPIEEVAVNALVTWRDIRELEFAKDAIKRLLDVARERGYPEEGGLPSAKPDPTFRREDQ